MLRTPRCTLPAALLVALLAGCASTPANTITPGYEGAPGVRKLLVCAPNTVLGLPAELQRGTEPLGSQIDAYLKEQGREVEWVDLYEAKQAWGRALLQAKESGAIARTPEFFAKELAETREFDAIVMPSVLLHQARAGASVARWDGVRRKLRTVGAPQQAVGRGQDTFAQGIAYGGISGDVAVTSVHVMVFTADGERVFEGRGGIELLHDLDMSEAQTRRRWSFRLREDLFRTTSDLREGVEIAFHPYIARPEE